MYETIIVAVCVALSVACLSKANIKLTITHNYSQPIVDSVDNITQEQVDDVYTKESIPTFDEVLKLAQELIGGDDDAD